MTKRFSVTEAPLTGANLIESSAGTGKTYTISGIFLRLVVEQGLMPEQILVVTFTRAGTEELRDRIRTRLVGAVESFGTGKHQDPLIEKMAAVLPERSLGLRRLQGALAEFDRAAIFTIHAFCQRLLGDYAYETKRLFDTELTTDSDRLMEEVAEDFWRRHFLDSLPELATFVLSRGIGPNTFRDLLRRVCSPDIRIIPAAGAQPAPDASVYRKTKEAFKAIWRKGCIEAAELLCRPDLNANVYGGLPRGQDESLSPRRLKVIRLLDTINNFVENDAPFPPPDELIYFTAGKISNAVKKGARLPLHPLFDAAEVLFQAARQLRIEYENLIKCLKIEFFSYAAAELRKRKQRRNIQFFDDLLLSLRSALHGEGGGVLAGAVRQRFRTALVDEFQDTDLIQYEIFSRLFAGNGQLLFMIGDPKQAIYGFRGADVFSYLKASASADRKYTLTENWRSTHRLIESVNTLFSGVSSPFIFSGIPFDPVLPAPGGPAGALRRLPSGSAMELWLVDRPDGRPTNAVEITARVLTSITREIRSLIGAENADVDASDIAVLVRTNEQARQVKQYLAKACIPAVLISAGSVFDTREACIMEWLLAAIAEPADIARLKAALATELFAFDGAQLQGTADAKWLAECQMRFQDYRRLWFRDGFITMFRRLLDREKCRARLLAAPDGERRLTNLVHLSELLQQEAMLNHRRPIELIRWLIDQKHNGATAVEAHQLRLESDARAVHILTVHKSKGLEFPVVFYPFSWQGVSAPSSPPVFHHLAGDGRLTADMGSEKLEDHLLISRNEAMAEEVRLLYVAVTRARQRCYLVWNRPTERAVPGALAYLLHADANCLPEPGSFPGQEALLKDLSASLKARLSGLGDDDFRVALRDLEKRSAGAIQVRHIDIRGTAELPDNADNELVALERRYFHRKLDPAWQVSSYSALVLSRAAESHFKGPEIRDPSLVEGLENRSSEAVPDIFLFPRGTRAGLFFHDLLEQIDRNGTGQAERQRLVERMLGKYGFGEAWREVISDMLNKVMAAPLEIGDTVTRLESVPLENQVRELEFYFPLRLVTPETLEQAFRRNGGLNIPGRWREQLGRLTFSPAVGFMRGFIDLVFCSSGRYYLLDWKSNHLGSTLADYSGKRLAEAMIESNYFLQYHLYTLALHRYLSARLSGYRYERHFGGVFYVFLRGVDPQHFAGAGIFADRPPAQLIQALDHILVGKPANRASGGSDQKGA